MRDAVVQGEKGGDWLGWERAREVVKCDVRDAVVQGERKAGLGLGRQGSGRHWRVSWPPCVCKMCAHGSALGTEIKDIRKGKKGWPDAWARAQSGVR